MRPEDWKEAWDVYQRAGNLDEPERETYLENALARNPEVREAVLSLLAEHEEEDNSVAGAPTAIGPYRLIKAIGEGGMGTVFLAEQQRPLRRKVALKLIRRGLQTREVLARFEIERQALATLDHPNIARVFDAGTAEPHGHPYFVMEFVDGLHITRYCEERRLDLRARLKLIQQVCDAVQHAHSRAIIHRDIKPANVLVTEQDGKPVPRVIDFGVAKAIGDASPGDTMATSFGSVVGTLRYMSPEQALQSSDVDARTDVYSVGVLLYEILTGSTPLTWDDENTVNLPLAIKRIAEVDPPPPSRCLGESSTSPRFNQALQGEIDWIVMKALEKDRDRRYRTAHALARDIQRYLDGEPVEAGPPSRSYRLAKLARRYRAWLATAAVFIVVLLAATLVSTREAFRAMRAEQAAVKERDRARLAEANARAERDRAIAAEAATGKAQELTLLEKFRADNETATARAVAEFLQNDLLALASPNTQAGPTQPPDPNLTVRAALDRSAAALPSRFQGQPLVRASLEHTIGSAYLDLGLALQAREHATKAVEFRRKALGPWHAETLASMDLLAMAYRVEGQLASAGKIWTNLYRHQRTTLGESNAATLKTLHALAALARSQGKYQQAADSYEQVFRLRRRFLGPEHPETMKTANNLAYAYMFVGKHDQARVMHQENLRLRRRILGEEHPDTLISMSNLALAYQHLKRHAEARALLEQTLAVQRRLLGPGHSSTLATMLNLGLLLRDVGNLPEAEKVYTEALELCRRTQQETTPLALTIMNNLGNIYTANAQWPRAEETLSRAWALSRDTLGPEHPDTLRPMLNLGSVYRQQGKYQQAEPMISQAVRARERLFGDEAPATLLAVTNLVNLYLDTGKHDRAAELARKTWEIRKRTLGDENALTVESLIQRTRAAVGQNDDTEARNLGERALAIRKRLHGAESAETLEVMELLAWNSLKAGRAREAEESFAMCLAARRRTAGDAHPATLKTMLALASSLDQQGQRDRADTLRAQVQTLKRPAADHLHPAVP